jgi:hypothetical protein
MGSEADQSQLSRTDVRNDGAIPPLPHMLHRMVLELNTGTTLSSYFTSFNYNWLAYLTY